MTATRVFDVVGASLALVVTSPVMLLVAVVVAATDGRPVLYRQRRIGRAGQPFTLHKFRTMRTTTTPTEFAAGDTTRVTRTGAVLRATKLDELPQLIDVLRGPMSLVGPRPEVASWVAAFPDRFARVHEVKPGLTDPAAIAFRHEEVLLARSPDPTATYRDDVLPRKLDLYDDYVRTRSLGGDIMILLRTLAALLRPRPPDPKAPA